MSSFAKLGLVRVEGQLLYWFFDYSLGKVILVILINKTRFFFLFEEFLRFYGKVFGSKVYLYVGSPSKLFLFRGLQYIDLQVRLVGMISKRLFDIIFVNKWFFFDLGLFYKGRQAQFYVGKYYVEGIREFSGVYKCFYCNLSRFYLRYFNFFIFFFFSGIYLLTNRKIWQYCYLWAGLQYCFSYFYFFIFFYFYFYFSKKLNRDIGGKVGLINISKLLFSRNVIGLTSIISLCLNIRRQLLLLRDFLFLLKRRRKRRFRFDLYLYECLVSRIKDFIKLGVNYKNFLKSFRKFFMITRLLYWRKWVDVMWFRGLNLYLNIKFRISLWKTRLADFSHYYYWNEGKVFGLWFTPLFRKVNFRYYLWWLKNLSLFFVRKNSKQFFSLFGLGGVQRFKGVIRSFSYYGWKCLFSISLWFKLVFLYLFYDFVRKDFWLYICISFFKSLVRNILKFIHMWAYKVCSGVRFRDMYFWVWVNLVENFFNFYHNSDITVVAKVLYHYMGIFFSFVLGRFPWWTLKKIKGYFKKLYLRLFFTSFWNSFKYYNVYICVWYVVVYIVMLIYVCFFFKKELGVKFYFGDYWADWDLQLVKLIENCEAVGWQDMFRINNYKIFGKLLNQGLKSGLNYSNIVSLTSNWFWNRFSKKVNLGSIHWDKFILLKLVKFLKRSKVKYQKRVFKLFRRYYEKIGVGNPKYFCNFLSGGRIWLECYWNYTNLVACQNSLQKFPKEIWTRGFKSLLYGRRMSNLLSLVNFGSDLYSDKLFRIVYRFTFRRIKREWKWLFDLYFDYYRSKEAMRRELLGKKVKEWLKLKRKRRQARRWRYVLTKPQLVLLNRQWSKVEKDRIVYRRRQQKVSGRERALKSLGVSGKGRERVLDKMVNPIHMYRRLGFQKRTGRFFVKKSFYGRKV